MTAEIVSARNDAPRVHCPVEGCTYSMPNAGSIPAHVAMAHPEVPMDAIAPKRSAPDTHTEAWFAEQATQYDLPGTSPAAPAASPTAGAATTELPIGDIVVRDNVRIELRGLDELAASIREHGLLSPVMVQRDGEAWVLVDGHRRLEASRLAELERIPITVRPGERPDVEGRRPRARRADVGRVPGGGVVSAGFALPKQRAIDEPRPLLRALTEDDLVRSYSAPTTPVPCACGTDVAYTTDEAVPLVVARHNATIAHLAWRAQQEP